MSKYEIRIDRESCMGDRLCSQQAPETFHVDDEGKVTVRDPAGDSIEHILTAASTCEREAITLVDAETGEEVRIGEALGALFKEKDVLDRVFREHRDLRSTILHLHRLIEGESPARGDELAKKLRELQASLSAHFQVEERSGLFEDLLQQHPRAARDVESLRADHGRILADLRAVLELVERGGTDRDETLDEVRARIGSLLAGAARHEEEETSLIGKLFSEDLGTAD